MTSETTNKIKWRIKYWYRDGKTMCRGHIITEASEDFTEEDAEEYLARIAEGEDSIPRAVQEMDFFKNYVCGVNPCDFGVLSVKRVKL